MVMHEAEIIRNIIEEITRLLNNTYLHVAPYQVGIDSRVQAIGECLGVGFDDVRIIGILGMGGMGKTTVAKAIYNEFYDRFEGKSFLEKVREKKQVDLQKQLLSDILKPTKIKVSSVAQGIKVIEKRLGSLKVLVIIDDIDSVEQLEALAIKRDTLPKGIYRAQPMEEEEALELLSWHAFKNTFPNKGYFELARELVGYCRGLPLALQVLGCSLFRRSTENWESTLAKLKEIPCDEIHNLLKISYDRLNDCQKDIFGDISCFFIGMDKNYVTQILDGCGFFAKIGIAVLLERCLVTVNEKNKLMMHDLLRDMGREIERAKSPKYPGKRSRLWHPENVKAVLMTKSVSTLSIWFFAKCMFYKRSICNKLYALNGTEEIEGLVLNLPSLEETSFSTEAFSNMKRLRLLKLNYVQLTGGYKYLSENLRWLCWRGFPLEFIPKNLCQPNIVAINMRYSNLRQVLCNDSETLEKFYIY
ncbi:Putative disease resistance TIR-NBS-LRR class protein [Prunus dulcis]|uniref:Disease resistance TIR-NBS-LRR class protein n=1 Tax=Prunus dulcis TaxID=3755 RepID=A0A4Y1QVR9_PRUDU|nr:Putative disease resistance TIR-NBS-LRR class protein [Prunus dulcis]